MSLFNTSVTALKSDTHVLKSHTKWWVSFVSDLSTKRRLWEVASSADWSTALEREAVIRPLAEQLRLVLPQLCATEAEDVGLHRPGVPLTILVSDLSTWSWRAYTI